MSHKTGIDIFFIKHVYDVVGIRKVRAISTRNKKTGLLFLEYGKDITEYL